MIFNFNGLYTRHNLLGDTREYSIVFRSASEVILIIVIEGFLEPTLIISQGRLLMAWLFSTLFVMISRFRLRRKIYSLRKQGFFLTPTVIVGANQEGCWLPEQLLHWETSVLHLVGFVDNKTPATFPLFHDLVSLGSVDQLGENVEHIVSNLSIPLEEGKILVRGMQLVEIEYRPESICSVLFLTLMALVMTLVLLTLSVGPKILGAVRKSLSSRANMESVV